MPKNIVKRINLLETEIEDLKKKVARLNAVAKRLAAAIQNEKDKAG